MKNLNELPQISQNNGDLTPWEMSEQQSSTAFNYDDEILDERDYAADRMFPRNNGTPAGFEALRASLARG